MVVYPEDEMYGNADDDYGYDNDNDGGDGGTPADLCAGLHGAATYVSVGGHLELGSR